MSPYEAARRGAVVRRRRERGTLQVTGADRLEWLNGLLTNDLKSHAGPTALYSLWLTPQGRMVSDLIVVETGEETLLDVPAPLAASLAEKLDRMIFAEEARVADLSAEMTSLGLYGPESLSFLRVATGEGEGRRREAAEDPAAVALALPPMVCTHAIASGLVGTHIYLPRGDADRLESSLMAQGTWLPIDDATMEVLRVEGGVPAFLVDMGEDTIPLEAGLDAAISHTKGCYVGQEIIVRIRDRAHGRVARKLVGLSFQDGAAPRVPQGVTGDGRQAGRVTSAVMSAAVGHSIALATLLRDFTEPGTHVILEDGTPAVVTALPFVG